MPEQGGSATTPWSTVLANRRARVTVCIIEQFGSCVCALCVNGFVRSWAPLVKHKVCVVSMFSSYTKVSDFLKTGVQTSNMIHRRASCRPE